MGLKALTFLIFISFFASACSSGIEQSLSDSSTVSASERASSANESVSEPTLALSPNSSFHWGSDSLSNSYIRSSASMDLFVHPPTGRANRDEVIVSGHCDHTGYDYLKIEWDLFDANQQTQFKIKSDGTVMGNLPPWAKLELDSGKTLYGTCQKGKFSVRVPVLVLKGKIENNGLTFKEDASGTTTIPRAGVYYLDLKPSPCSKAKNSLSDICYSPQAQRSYRVRLNVTTVSQYIPSN